jgi:hypothetical protein
MRKEGFMANCAILEHPSISTIDRVQVLLVLELAGIQPAVIFTPSPLPQPSE